MPSNLFLGAGVLDNGLVDARVREYLRSTIALRFAVNRQGWLTVLWLRVLP